MRDSGELPSFDGARTTLDLISALYVKQPRDHADLPMLCLVRPAEHEGLLRAISHRLDEARPYRVPHALVELEGTIRLPRDAGPERLSEPTHADVEQVRDLLVDIAHELAQARNSRTGRLRFPRLSLAVWLMAHEVRLGGENTPRVLRRQLRERGIDQRMSGALDALEQRAQDLPAWLRWAPGLIGVLPPVWFRIKSSGRIPLLSAEFRWFLRQPYLAAENPGTFIGFAERLSASGWQRESPEQLLKFLTNAFLEDLRRSHAGSARRTTNAVVLLDHITLFNGGYRLLDLINEVRNDTGRSDPLLLITGSRYVPPYRTAPDSGEGRPKAYRPTEAGNGYREWRDALDLARKQRKEIAWYLPIRIPDSADRGDPPIYTFGMHRPPWWSRRLASVGAVVAVVAALTTGYAAWSHQHCEAWPGLAPPLTRIGGECVGISDGSHPLLQPADANLDAVRAQILGNNRRAAELHERTPQRPYVTLAYIGALTSSSGDASGLVAKREELAGVAVAQHAALERRGTPLVRVLLVNAGRDMRHGPEVARRLGEFADQEAPLVGVIGLDRSSTQTDETIRVLTRAGLPMVAAPLTADRAAADFPMYYQVAPQNRRQSLVAAALVAHLAENDVLGQGAFERSARIYHSDDPTDIYSANLRQDVETALRAEGFAVESRAFSTDGAWSAGQSACGHPGLVYYAGRGVPEFDLFLGGVGTSCRSDPPLLLGGHDTSRYVADRAMRERNRKIPLLYQTSAIGPASDDPLTEARLTEAEQVFYGELFRLFPFERTAEGRSRDGHAALAHDAALTMITAVQHLHGAGIPVSPAAVWRELNNIHEGGSGTVEGATGVLDFGGTLGRNVPEDKPVAILRVDADGAVDPNVVWYCPQSARPAPPLVALACPATG
ncbi:hypothetical protein LZ318_38240 [Saccharopolyspora indica]|uniref:hypothetical protein n=1 Tax=Saccharopolyspora indica TaxID=1229659 RepID=UPI0022EA16FA|nr:hypothetical protein [Saccharopolyspora indica]MDA3642800.1 hypothetical protein [Saccharopolyspora indica]